MAVVRGMDQLYQAVETVQEVFRVSLTLEGRGYRARGALRYRRAPLAARLDLYGPLSSPVLHAVVRGDSLDLLIPEGAGSPTAEGEALRELPWREDLPLRELVGGLTGLMDVAELSRRAQEVEGWATDVGLHLRLAVDETEHRLLVSPRDWSLREYRRRGPDKAYSMEWSDYRTVRGLPRPRTVRFEWPDGELSLVAHLERERLDAPLEEGIFILPGGLR